MRRNEVTPPKTKGSVRTFDIDKSIIEILKDHKIKQEKLQKQYRSIFDDFANENYVFGREKRISYPAEDTHKSDEGRLVLVMTMQKRL